MARKKRKIEKQIKGLEKIRKKHLKKLGIEKTKLDTTPEYWKKEIREFEKQIKEKKDKLRMKK